MREIYEQASNVCVWLGRDTKQYQAKLAVDSIRIISNFLCDKLGIKASDLSSIKDPLYDVLTKKREVIPLPNECDFSKDDVWEALVWFYSHPYFTRVWIIQEINVPCGRVLHCGYEQIEWERVDLVAGYIIMETAFSKAYGFTNAYCWWAASLVEISLSKSWIFMLYLASNFSCTDHRDFIYGLRGLMTFSDGAELLLPDYRKSVTEVYRDCAEAALINFKNVDILYYVRGAENPSWVPRWDKAMLFRNPFRLTSGVPWRPTGKTVPIWSIDKKESILTIQGISLGIIEFAESYNESIFGTVIASSPEGVKELNQIWSKILKIFENKFPVPLSAEVITAAAVSLSFGLNEKKELGEDRKLMLNFISYLNTALDEWTFRKFISAELAEESKSADGSAFGKPVWDFTYPESSLFITEDGLIGCTISSIKPHDVVFAALGSSYPHILRLDTKRYYIRGYSFIYGVMNGEKKDSDIYNFDIC
ncbi:heterokaryon incompatibility protein [Rutstroemia sp. NJR-2017a BVV2]|nr:heterokaryon incompatibility protein [Rutstroemia sp. NJR-2017a BVV2]